MEIERRFLVNDKVQLNVMPIIISQGYMLSDDKSNLRVRLSDTQGFITYKNKISDMSNHEYEYEIPSSDASEMIRLSKYKISKLRYILPYHKDIVWEIDRFENGLIIAEIEIPSEDFELDLPEWIEKEITGEFEYSNLYMAKNGLKEK